MKLRHLALFVGALSICASALAAPQPPTVPPSPPNAEPSPVVVYDGNGNVVNNYGGAAPGSKDQDVRATGTLDATKTTGSTSYIDIAVNGQATVGFRFSGLTGSGATISFLQSNDGGTTYTAVSEVNAGTGVLTQTRTTDGQTRVNAAGRTNIRVQVTAAGTGTISVAYNVSVRAFGMAIDAPLPPGTNAIGSVSPSGLTRTRLSCTLPAYASGGNAVCTDQAGVQTTTTCAASTACLISASNANRKTMFAMNRTANSTIDLGYAATTSPGTGVGLDGPSATGMQGGSYEENPAHVGAYYAAASAAATLVFVQGQ